MIQSRFSIRPERRYHAIAGFSMGGYGTWLTASQLPGFFGTVPLSAFASIRTFESTSPSRRRPAALRPGVRRPDRFLRGRA